MSARSIPASTNDINPCLGEHTDETPRGAASDGGVVKEDRRRQ
jgi:hypothetical protein